MSSIDEKMSVVAEQVLKRPLTEAEQLEMYKISDAMGMGNIQSFLHQLLVFKLYEDTLRGQFEQLQAHEERMNEKIEGLAALERRITATLEMSVERVLGEGAERIGADMGDKIAAQVKGIFSAVGAYHSLKGQILVACAICGSGALGYFLGLGDVLRLVPGGGVLQTLIFLPAGWCFFLCGMTYTFLWIGDNWVNIRKRKLYKAFLGGQVLALLLLVVGLV